MRRNAAKVSCKTTPPRVSSSTEPLAMPQRVRPVQKGVDRRHPKCGRGRATRVARPDEGRVLRNLTFESSNTIRTYPRLVADTDMIRPADTRRPPTDRHTTSKRVSKQVHGARHAAAPPYAAAAWRQLAHNLPRYGGGGPGQRRAHSKGCSGCAGSPTVARACRESDWREGHQRGRHGRACKGTRCGLPVSVRATRTASIAGTEA